MLECGRGCGSGHGIPNGQPREEQSAHGTCKSGRGAEASRCLHRLRTRRAPHATDIDTEGKLIAIDEGTVRQRTWFHAREDQARRVSRVFGSGLGIPRSASPERACRFRKPRVFFS